MLLYQAICGFMPHHLGNNDGSRLFKIAGASQKSIETCTALTKPLSVAALILFTFYFATEVAKITLVRDCQRGKTTASTN